MNLNIRKMEKKDEKEIQNALKSISDMSEEQWKWKFSGNPEPQSRIWVVEYDEVLAGHMTLQGMNFNINSKTIPGCQAVDLFIKEDYRRKGLFVKLGKTSLDESGKVNMNIAIGFPNREALGGHLKYGWKQIGMIPRAFKPLDINRYSASVKKKPPLLKLALKFKSREKSIPKHELGIDEIQSFPENIGKFSKEALRNRNTVERTSAFLNWRYCRAPHRKYVKFIASQADEIIGYIVGYESTKNKGNGYIADLLVHPGDIVTARALISKLENHFLADKVFAVYSWIPHMDGINQAFNDSGYIFRKPTQPFIVRLNKEIEGMENIFDFNRWFITMGDSDLH